MESNVERLIADGETYTVEFKSDVNDDELTEAAVCLANGDGGQILIGVADDGALVGAQPRHGDTTEPRKLEALIANKTSPALSVAVATERLEGLEVVIVNVPKARSLVATTAWRYVRRAIRVDGKPVCLPMLPHEAQARTTLLGGGDLSASPLVELSIADLDPVEFDRFRRLAGGGGDEHLSELSNRDLLSALGVRSVDGSLTLDAALLFGTPTVLRTFVPTHSVVFQALDEHDAVRANRDLHVPLVRAMVELAEAVKPYNPEEEIDDGLFRLGLPLYSEIAVRELIANALVHRDYSINGQVRVAVEGSQALAVNNPGGFPDGITIHNLLTSIGFQADELGRQLVRQLLEIIADPTSEPSTTLVEPELFVRESTTFSTPAKPHPGGRPPRTPTSEAAHSQHWLRREPVGPEGSRSCCVDESHRPGRGSTPRGQSHERAPDQP